ncbi:hypothetical protein SanaruYs_11410 [Chryseotalea sanaruensis]|uniref:Uncharacterized protein n=1 Tax=Chryseotalea sanaruensis TaxID=2482724 RepID=A0A401U7Q9_9BACT|nr:hypothetical protein [Chryseotalea sanaruensis]GCC50922.1 hypothetical protein SanaruYs_11410 [Chryseotalea sanaruensis]
MNRSQSLLNGNQQQKISAKRNKIILLSLFVLLLCSTVFAYLQRREAKLQKVLSEKLMEDLQQVRAVAEKAQLEAMMQRDLAAKSETMCNQALQACQQKRK